MPVLQALTVQTTIRLYIFFLRIQLFLNYAIRCEKQNAGFITEFVASQEMILVLIISSLRLNREGVIAELRQFI